MQLGRIVRYCKSFLFVAKRFSRFNNFKLRVPDNRPQLVGLIHSAGKRHSRHDSTIWGSFHIIPKLFMNPKWGWRTIGAWGIKTYIHFFFLRWYSVLALLCNSQIFWSLNLPVLQFSPLVPGSPGPWSSGPLALWSLGPLLFLSLGPPVPWSSGPLVLWSSGPLVLPSFGVP